MKKIKKYGVEVALIFGVVALVMLFLQGAIVPREELGWEFKNSSVFEVIFGLNSRLSPKLNILAFVSMLLLIVGMVTALLTMLPPGIRYGASGLLLLISGIFLFLIPFTVTLDNVRKVVLGAPLIVSGVFALLAGVLNGVLAVLHLLKNK